MTKVKYQCSTCGREVFNRSICKDCEKIAHRRLHSISTHPPAIERMESQ